MAAILVPPDSEKLGMYLRIAFTVSTSVAAGILVMDEFLGDGAGAVLLPGVSIGEYDLISAGAVLASDVSPGAIVRGDASRVL